MLGSLTQLFKRLRSVLFNKICFLIMILMIHFTVHFSVLMDVRKLGCESYPVSLNQNNKTKKCRFN